MITLTTNATNRATYPLQISFTNSNGEATLPTSATWDLSDQYGNIINSREDVPISVAETVIIVLTGDDIDIENESVRYLTVNAEYNSDTYGNFLTSREQAKFEIGEWVEPEPSV